MKGLRLFLLAALLLPLGARAEEVRYVDAASLTVINKAMDDGTMFKRIDLDRYPDLTKDVNRLYRYSAGIAVVFRTDSKNISARWTTGIKAKKRNTPVIAQCGLDLYIQVGGEWVYAGFGDPAFDSSEHESGMVLEMDGQMHECLLYLPLFAEVTSLEIGVDPDAVIEAAENPFHNKVVIFGSSITHGVGSSRPGMCYPSRLERHFGVEFVNLGTDGQCKLDGFFARIAGDTEADAFIFDPFSNPGADQIEERLEEFIRIIREKHPLTPLIFLQTEYRETRNFNQSIQSIEEEKYVVSERMMRKIMAEDENVYFISPGMWLGDDHEATVDGVHPTDLGFDRMMGHFLPALSKILADYGIIQ